MGESNSQNFRALMATRSRKHASPTIRKGCKKMVSRVFALLLAGFVAVSFSQRISGAAESGVTIPIMYYCTPSATGQGGSEDIEDVINNLLADGDTVILTEGTYYVTNGLLATEAEVTLLGTTGNPEDVIVDGSDISWGDSILNITTTGNWTIKGITFQYSKAGGGRGEVTINNGHLDMFDCIVKGSLFGYNGVSVISLTAAASGTFVNCEMFGFASDGISSRLSAGAFHDRVVTAHFCYFHDINKYAYSQAMTPHNNSAMKAYFCRFDNIGTDGTGNAIGTGTGDNPIEAYNCIITNCNSGIGATGALVVKNCIFDNIVGDAIIQSEKAKDVLIENCTFTNVGRYAIYPCGGGYTVIRRCRIDHSGASNEAEAINTLDGAPPNASDRTKSITIEDCVIYSPSDSVSVLSSKYRDLFIRRNLIWTELNSYLNGAIHTFYSIDNEVQLVAEHNCIYKVAGPIFSTWGSSGYGCDVAPGSYVGGWNTYQIGCFFGRDKTYTGNWQASVTDQAKEIEWRSLTREFMLPMDSPYYRDHGAAMMSAWSALPPFEGMEGTYAQDYLVTGFSPCIMGYYLDSDLNCDCVVDMEDFAIFAEDWLADTRP